MSFKFGEKKEVIQNRKNFFTKNGVNIEDCLFMRVEDGEKIIIVDSTYKSSAESFISADVLMTKDKDLILVLLTGDCLPISLFDPKNKVIALAHLGWKSTNLKLIGKVIEEMKNKFNSNPQDILVYIGPGIHKESYLFQDPLQKTLPDWQPFLTSLSSGETQVDIVGYNNFQMLDAGLQKENIFIDPTDTVISENYFSHYRSVRTGEPEGRFATIIALK